MRLLKTFNKHMELILKSVCCKALVGTIDPDKDGYTCEACKQKCQVIKTYADSTCEGCQ